MTTDEINQLTEPPDPVEAGVGPLAADASDPDDTEGHSLLTVEMDRANRQDRARETDKLVRDGARARDAHSKSDGGFLKRFRRG